ncbi:MAG: ESPR domain-containing protein [Acidaminococcaceae bacterium]|nr:ESPR domain-containing protein [Acidaminococcaceae bacterium]
MNRIYKVVWSKAKNCYVVASELAKRHTKGSGTRSLSRAAVTLGIVAGLTVGMTGSVWAEVGYINIHTHLNVATTDGSTVGGPTTIIALDSNPTGSVLYGVSTDVANLNGLITNLGNGSTVITTTEIANYAKTDASNISVGNYATKLGTGAVATGDTNLVTGGTVYTALGDYAKTDASNINVAIMQVR